MSGHASKDLPLASLQSNSSEFHSSVLSGILTNTMRQKIVIKVTLKDQKSRSRALKIARGVSKVESAGLEGHDLSHIEIVGDGVDAAELATMLRKKVGHAEIVWVGPVGDEKAKNAQQVVEPYDYGGSQTNTVQEPRYHISKPKTCSIL